MLSGSGKTKRRVCTTISESHWKILDKHTAKFETQQKVLEAALERMDNDINQSSILSPEEQLWLRACNELRPNLCIIHKDLLKELIRSADIKRYSKLIEKMNLTEYQVIIYCQKPIEECSLKEVMDGLVQTFKLVNMFDTIDYVDCADHYSLKVIHTLGQEKIDYSKSLKSSFEKLFKKCSLKTECEISEGGLFMKVYKNGYPTKSA